MLRASVATPSEGGGASLAFELGLSLTQVKQRGDWASSAVENYIFVSPRIIREVASVMINGVPRMLLE